MSSVWTIAHVTWLRLIRGRALWVAFLIAFVPIAYASAMTGRRGGIAIVGLELFTFITLIVAVLAPMFVASSIGEDIEDRTATYLWSRPVPRWAVFAGKLVALVPITAALGLVSWNLAAYIAWGIVPAAYTSVAVLAAVASVSVVSAGIASLAPKHGMALSIVYMLFVDLPLGVRPATLREISLSYQARVLAALEEGYASTAAIALVTVCVVWALIAAWRVRRLEV